MRNFVTIICILMLSISVCFAADEEEKKPEKPDGLVIIGISK